MANSKRVRVRIVNPPPGCRDSTSLDRARRYVKRGRANWLEGALFFHDDVPESSLQDPTAEPVVVSIGDSGQDGFTRYPLPMRTTVTPKWPALGRRGAGLAA